MSTQLCKLGLIALGSLLIVCCKNHKDRDDRDSVAIFQKSIGFNAIPLGYTSEGTQVNITNNSQEDIQIMSAKVNAPFYIRSEFPISIKQAGYATISVAFKPTELGRIEDTVEVLLSNDKTLKVSISGEGVTPVESVPSEQWLDLELTQTTYQKTEDNVVITGQVMPHLKAGIPFHIKDATLAYNLEGLTNIGEVTFASDVGPVLPPSPVNFQITALPLVVIGNTEITASASLISLEGDTLFTYLSPPIFLQAGPPGPPPCSCPGGGAAPARVNLASNTSHFPDSPIPPGDPAGATPAKVAKVEVTIDGPGAGTCCKPPVNVDFKLQVASDFPLPGGGGVNGNDNTGHQIIRACRGVGGMSITAQTNGAAHGVSSAAGSAHACPAGAGAPALPAPGNPIGNIILETTHQVPISCTENAQCPCGLTGNVFITRFIYNGAGGLGGGVAGGGGGGIVVRWTLAMGAPNPGNNNCLTKAVTGNIEGVVFVRGGNIYRADQHANGWIPWNADPDGDFRPNITEYLEGKDPNTID